MNHTVFKKAPDSVNASENCNSSYKVIHGHPFYRECQGKEVDIIG